jgi:hypothetical protein
MRMVQRVRVGAWEHERGKIDDRRDPPVPVTVWLPLDSRDWEGELWGWAANPNGGDDGWRGLVFLMREFAPGFWAEFLGWVRGEHIRPLIRT